MKKRDTKFLQAEDAQSEVIGFVLILGILLSASTIYLSIQVPNWTGDYESQHTANVADDFSELKVLVDGIKGEAFERTTTIKMSPDKVPIFGTSTPGSNLVFNPGAEKFELIVPGGGGSGGSGSWTIPNSSFTDYYDAGDSNRVSASSEVTLSGPTATDLILDNTQMELTGDITYPFVHNYGQLILKNNSVLSVTPATGVLRIYARNITVDASSKINADGRGNPGGGSEASGSGTGYGIAAVTDYDDGGGGAGYGGEGGDGGGTYAGVGGVKYGDETSVFIQMGSGGGGGGDEPYGTAGAGGTGGGAIWLDAERITIYGTVSVKGANGGAGSGSNDCGGGGGGSGGGILICGKYVTITGTLYAKGGNGGNGYWNGDGGGGGGGGRIKVFYEVGTVSPITSVSNGNGGSGSPGGQNGKDGTYYKKQAAYITSPTDVTYYSSGYFVSTVHDAGNESVRYGEMTWDATVHSELVMKVRTDWNKSMAYATPWNECPGLSSSNGENTIELSGVSSVSPVAHRYMQFRAELSTDDETETPVLNRIKINYSFPAQSPLLANASGSVKFNSNYHYYPNQEIVYEHGAVIKYQREGGFMLQEPPITITNKSGIPALSISMVDLTGANYSYSGATTTSVKSTYKDYDLLADELTYPNLTINLTTEYPSVWGDWFNTTLKESGLGSSYYTVSVTGNNVQVKLDGKGNGVELYLEKTEVEVKI
jgi:hypothetical protein